jgi:hypothetical protein
LIFAIDGISLVAGTKLGLGLREIYCRTEKSINASIDKSCRRKGDG